MFLLVHLSDLHIDKTNNPVLVIKNKILNTFKNRLSDVKKVFFVVTGDISYSGNKDEYLLAYDLLGFLKSETDKILDFESAIIMVPGNHDCTIDKAKEGVRSTLIDKINSDGIDVVDEYTIDVCCSCQENFISFVESIHDTSNISYHDKLLRIYNYDVGDKNIQFNWGGSGVRLDLLTFF